MICRLCPRNCGAERTDTEGHGFCRMSATLRVARAGLHHWEEPPISGTKGSGAIFFSGCTLRCCFCQNSSISQEGFGKAITPLRLREIMGGLIAQGAHNINLVTPSHFTPQILEALEGEPLGVPVVWNCGGYEKIDTLRQLEGKVDIYLPDLKYADGDLARKLSGAADYFPVATAAIEEMFRQVGPCVMEDGLLRRGVVIRHMMLPGKLSNTKAVIDYVARTFRSGEVLFSLMSQYTPQPGAQGFLGRTVRRSEYRAAAEYMAACGIEDGFLQGDGAAKTEYTPAFDLTGV